MKASTLGPKPAGAELLNMVYRPIEELKLDPANPRLHSKKQIRQIANSIKTFGFNVPILTDRDDQVIDPAYTDTTIRRWQALTGRNAHHAASGRSFDDLAKEGEAANVV